MSLSPYIFLCVLVTLALSTNCAQAQTCRNYTFSSNITYNSCIDLPVLNSFLHWNYYPLNKTVSVAYRHANTTSSRWSAWAINPTGSGMVGSQAFVASHSSDGAVTMSDVYTTPITSYAPLLQQRGTLSFAVYELSVEYSNNEMIIFATLDLPEGSNGTSVNHVWQEGPLIGGVPSGHPTTGANLQGMGTIDFLSG